MFFVNNLKFLTRQNYSRTGGLVESINYTYRCKTKQVSVTEVPERPKKPAPSFFRFLETVRLDYQKNFPNYSMKDIMKIASNKWKTLSEDEKSPFREAYIQDSLKYADSMLRYEHNLTPQQTQLLAKNTEKEIIKKKMKEFSKPKRPPTSFSLFLSDRKGEINKYNELKEWFRAMSIEWKELPEDKKHTYKMKAEELSKKYYKDLYEWEETILNSINPHVSSLKKVVTHSRKIRKSVS